MKIIFEWISAPENILWSTSDFARLSSIIKGSLCPLLEIKTIKLNFTPYVSFHPSVQDVSVVGRDVNASIGIQILKRWMQGKDVVLSFYGELSNI